MSGKIKAVMFDVGGVITGSPIVGIQNFEKKHGLPDNYLNAAITGHGKEGAFQRLERGEFATFSEFYTDFGRELSDCAFNNTVYRAHCAKRGIALNEASLPRKLAIDGKEMWAEMMEPATHVDPIVIKAIQRLNLSGKFRLIALTNNSKTSGSQAADPVPLGLDILHATPEELQASLRTLSLEKKGSPSEQLKALFHDFIESSLVGLRKPDPRIYELALSRNGVKAEEVVFLDDIGMNLVAAKKLGINTIRVYPGRSLEAVRELETYVGIQLLDSKL